MNKKDCEVGMFVAVLHSTSSLPRSRTKIRKVGRIIGIYDDFVNLLLFDSNIRNMDIKKENVEYVIIKRKLYVESFRFYEIHKIQGEIVYEE